MSQRGYLVGLCLMSAASLLFVQLYQQRLSDPWEQLVLNPEFRDVLVRAMEHERKLAGLEPEHAEVYKQHFQQAQTLLGHLEILETNRRIITRRYNLILTLLLGASLSLIVLLLLYHRFRLEARLEVIRGYLGRLASGETDMEVSERGKDVIGRIGRMIQITSAVMARTSQRLKALENLEAWQESSRRMAHEIRTPLTTLRLEVDALVKAALRAAPQALGELSRHERGIREELTQLSAFTDEYTSFAKIGRPHPKPIDLVAFIGEFLEVYRQAWPNLALSAKLPQPGSAPVMADKRLVRQVLVNLCNNSSKALGEGMQGSVDLHLSHQEHRFVLAVTDSGPGVSPGIASRLFQPYATTRAVGEGTGLGLAISRKIMLDHGGDLELDPGPAPGARFLMVFPPAQAETGECP